MLPYCADLMRSLREYYKNEYDTVGAVTIQVSACESVLIKTSTIVIADRDVAEFAEKGFQLLPANHEEFKMKVRPEFALDKPAIFAHVRTCKHRCLSLKCSAYFTNEPFLLILQLRYWIARCANEVTTKFIICVSMWDQ